MLSSSAISMPTFMVLLLRSQPVPLCWFPTRVVLFLRFQPLRVSRFSGNGDRVTLSSFPGFVLSSPPLACGCVHGPCPPG